MANTASDHIKPCNIGQSEAHNRRTEAYLSHINKDKLYIRTDLMPDNESWISPQMEGMDLQSYHDAIARMVKEKTGRALQTKERTRIDKKTGKTVKMNGSSPIRESVVVCKAGTTMDELQRYCTACRDKWGITALQIHIHRDEGHYTNPADKVSWKPNYHAHIVWDWMNHDTGKSFKLGKVDMSAMQDMVAEALGMKRGTSKTETGSRHLERNDYIVAKQKMEAEKAIAAKEKAEAERMEGVSEIDTLHQKAEMLAEENRIKEQISSELDKEIAEKQNRMNEENGNAILSRLANLAGRGKYAAIEKENKELRAENKRIKEAFPIILKREVGKRTEQLSAEKQKAETERQALTKEKEEAVRQLNEQRTNEQQRIDRAIRETTQKQTEIIETLNCKLQWKSVLLKMLADLLYQAGGVFQRAIATIIDFATSQYKSIFSPSEAADIKEVMQSYGGKDAEQQRMIGKWLVDYAESRKQFDSIELKHACQEVNDIAQGHMIGKSKKKIRKNNINSCKNAVLKILIIFKNSTLLIFAMVYKISE